MVIPHVLYMRCSQRICVSTCKNFILNIKKREEKTHENELGIIIQPHEFSGDSRRSKNKAIYFGYNLRAELAEPLNIFYQGKVERNVAGND